MKCVERVNLYSPLGFLFSRTEKKGFRSHSAHSLRSVPTLADHHPWLNHAPPPTLASTSPSHRHCRSPKVFLFSVLNLNLLIYVPQLRLFYFFKSSSPSPLMFFLFGFLFSCGLSLTSVNPSFPEPAFLLLFLFPLFERPKCTSFSCSSLGFCFCFVCGAGTEVTFTNSLLPRDLRAAFCSFLNYL